MNDDQYDGGPAFPQHIPVSQRVDSIEGYLKHAGGMTLRDWFAGQALIGVLKARNGFLVDVGTENVAPWAYQVANAMLKERARLVDLEVGHE